jgi:signal transduction histidine kinase
MWRGVRVRITALAAVVVIIVLVATAAVLVATQRRLLTDNLDDTLSTQANDLAAIGVSGDAPRPLAPRGDDDSIAQIATTDGDVIAATANFASHAALPAPQGDATRHLRTAHLIAGEPDFRILSMRAGDHVIHVASPIDDIDESISALRLGLTGAIPIVAVVLATLIWWLIGRTLRPVEAIRREVATISGQNLHRRVPEPSSGDEIQRLAHTMNAMLDRVEHSAISQQRFVADASHELRSPLTRIRSELEVDLAHPDTADLLATHHSVLEETEQMQRLVEDLLVLARNDADPTTAAPHVPVDLDDIVLHEIHRISTSPDVHIDSSSVSAAQVDGDARQLARVVRNLLDNATRHAHGAVIVTLAEHDGIACLTITDDGPGIAPEHHDDVFARFSRIDDARTSDDGGTGLGLAIARSVTEHHVGTLRIDAHHHPGARFIVEIPTTHSGTSFSRHAEGDDAPGELG